MGEQRRFERFRFQTDVEIARGDTRIQAAMENLSLGGAMLCSEAEPRLGMGERFEVTFALPELKDAVRMEAEVRWINSVDPRFVGIKFLTGFRAKETWALNRLFSRLKAEQQSAQ